MLFDFCEGSCFIQRLKKTFKDFNIFVCILDIFFNVLSRLKLWSFAGGCGCCSSQGYKKRGRSDQRGRKKSGSVM